jgi:hypothetical protein
MYLHTSTAFVGAIGFPTAQYYTHLLTTTACNFFASAAWTSDYYHPDLCATKFKLAIHREFHHPRLHTPLVPGDASLSVLQGASPLKFAMHRDFSRPLPLIMHCSQHHRLRSGHSCSRPHKPNICDVTVVLSWVNTSLWMSCLRVNFQYNASVLLAGKTHTSQDRPTSSMARQDLLPCMVANLTRCIVSFRLECSPLECSPLGGNWWYAYRKKSMPSHAMTSINANKWALQRLTRSEIFFF